MGYIANETWKKLTVELIKHGVLLDNIHESFCLASGKGGQKINKTDSAVQLTYGSYHIQSSRYRSRDMNRYDARKKLLKKVQEDAGLETDASKAMIRRIKQKKRRKRRAKNNYNPDHKIVGI